MKKMENWHQDGPVQTSYPLFSISFLYIFTFPQFAPLEAPKPFSFIMSHLQSLSHFVEMIHKLSGLFTCLGLHSSLERFPTYIKINMNPAGVAL